METSVITRWFKSYRREHPTDTFLTALPALLAAHPEAGRHSAGTVAECFALAEPTTGGAS